MNYKEAKEFVLLCHKVDVSLDDVKYQMHRLTRIGVDASKVADIMKVTLEELNKPKAMTNIKIKSGSQVFAMLKRLQKEHAKCKKKKTFAHPDTIMLSGMLTMLTWVSCTSVDKQVSEFLRDLYKEVDIETFKPINKPKISKETRDKLNQLWQTKNTTKQ